MGWVICSTTSCKSDNITARAPSADATNPVKPTPHPNSNIRFCEKLVEGPQIPGASIRFGGDGNKYFENGEFGLLDFDLELEGPL